MLPFLSLTAHAGLPTLPQPAEPCASWAEPGVYELEIEHDGKKRQARIAVPTGEGPRALVVDMHGYWSTTKYQEKITGYEALALREGFVVAHPLGLGTFHGWNAGTCCAGPERQDVDDLGFLEALVATLSSRVCTDRVFATGLSNGGMMAERWACESDTVDGLIPVASAFVGEQGCSGSPVPYRAYHGTADKLVPLAGGGHFDLPTLDETLAVWRGRNQCTSAAPRETVHGDVRCLAWDCAAPTEECLVEGDPHAWTGSDVGPKMFSSLTDDADATTDGWAFFRTIAMPPNP